MISVTKSATLLSPPNFTVEYVSMKENIIVDFLSRHPLWEEDTGHGPMIKDDFGRTIPIEAHVHAAQILDRYADRIISDPMLEELRDAGSVDIVYTAVIKALRKEGPRLRSLAQRRISAGSLPVCQTTWQCWTTGTHLY